jgi:hypothetical protein
MIQPATIHRVSVEEYLAGEQTAEVKHEYVNGEVYAMVGVRLACLDLTLDLDAVYADSGVRA